MATKKPITDVLEALEGYKVDVEFREDGIRTLIVREGSADFYTLDEINLLSKRLKATYGSVRLTSDNKIELRFQQKVDEE